MSLAPAPPRIAIAQIRMHWTIEANLAAIVEALRLAHRHGATLCAFSELAITGFHRDIVNLAFPHRIDPAVAQVQALCAELSIAAALGAPTFDGQGGRFISHLLIDEAGVLTATISKEGLTAPEATFFKRGSGRAVGMLQGRRCSVVICREVEDFDCVTAQLPPGAADLVFLPGALRPDPAKPPTDPPEFVLDALRLARALRSTIVQTNWPNALNRPEESVDGGQSMVISPAGELLFRLPRQACGLGLFTLGERQFDWQPLP
jgi:predicted amidohydrolase